MIVESYAYVLASARATGTDTASVSFVARYYPLVIAAPAKCHERGAIVPRTRGPDDESSVDLFYTL